MSRIRFSIASLLVIVLCCAFALGALRAANAVWDQIVYSATWVCLLVAVLLAIHRTERSRAFWLGFALFGFAYFLVGQIGATRPRLITNQALSYAAGRLVPEETDLVQAVRWLSYQNHPNVRANLTPTPDGSGTISGTWDNVVLRWPSFTALSAGTANTESFVTIGHSLLAWVAGLLGGWLSRALYARGRSQRQG